jgi:phosphoribosylformimino-5-aminoimidazole carboxamide ribotide isomerase
MKVVPTLDLKAGSVVRAVAGQRDVYHPIESRLIEGSDPIAFGRAFADKFGLRHAYVADLDAIDGADPAWDIYVGLIGCGLSLWIDAGLSDQARIEQMVEFADDHSTVRGIIFGLESVPHIDTVVAGLRLAGPQRFIFSLDMKDGRPLARSEDWNGKIAANIARAVIEAGVQQILLIDLATVGMHGGCGTERLCRILHRKYPQVKFYAGGGIRGASDLEWLARHGCSAAVVSSSLHDGWLQPEDLEPYDLGA